MKIITDTSKLVIVSAIFCLFSCGGGGSTNDTSLPPPPSSSPPPVPTQPVLSTNSSIVANAGNNTPDSIEAAAKALADARYTGLTTPTNIDADNASQFAQLLFAAEEQHHFPFITRDYINELIETTSAINVVVSCTLSGSATIKGVVDSSTSLRISIAYDYCQDYRLTPFLTEVNGTMALVLQDFDDENMVGFTAYDGLSYQEDNLSQRVRLTGFYSFALTGGRQTAAELGERETHEYLSVVDSSSKVTLFDRKISAGEDSELIQDTGSIYLEQHGTVRFSATNFKIDRYPSAPGNIDLEGANIARFEITPPNQRVKLLVDTSTNGNFDKGLYYFSASELLNGGKAFSELTDLDLLSLPPNKAFIDFGNGFNDVYTNDTITATLVNFEDEDTSQEDLIVTYQWYLNARAMDDVTTSNEFPSNIAVHGDEVAVIASVSDGVNTVPSDRGSITIADTLPELTFSNMPNTVVERETLSFNAVVLDPDLSGSEQAAQFINLPEGASVDESGQITWEVPENILFSEQSYVFQVDIQYDGYKPYPLKDSIEITVKSDKQPPTITSQLASPSLVNSMYIDNFDNDSHKELLATDNRGTIYLMTLTESGMRRKWVYPLEFNADKRFSRGSFDTKVAPVELSTINSKKEILVIQDGVLFVIDDINQKPREFLKLNDIIETVKSADLDGDGIDEIFLGVRASNNAHYLYVFRTERLHLPLYFGEFEWFDSIEVGNVDNDIADEIVLSNGSVIDTDSWQVQWQISENVIFEHLILADVIGDGIKEIIGKGPANHLSIYSGGLQTMLATYELNYVNGLGALNIDDDAAQELVFGDFERNSLQILDYEDGVLQERYRSFPNNAQSFNTFAIGDIDNDTDPEAVLVDFGQYTNSSRFPIIELGQDKQTLVQHNEAIVSAYSFAGWASLDGIDDELVYLIEVGNEFVQGARFLTFKGGRDNELSNTFGNSRSYNPHGMVSDFNQDGFGDLFVNQVSNESKGVAALQLSDLGQWWESNLGEIFGDPIIVDAVDINGDGYDDMIYAYDQTVVAMDVYNNEELGSYRFEAGFPQFRALRSNGSGYIIAEFESNPSLTILKLSEAGLRETGEVDILDFCELTKTVNIDQDLNEEYLCVTLNYGRDPENTTSDFVFKYYKVEQDRLELSETVYVNHRISELVVDPRSNQSQSFFAVAQVKNSDGSFDLPKVVSMNVDGSVNWKGPQLIGTVEKSIALIEQMHARLNDNGKVELHISTQQHQYLIKE